MKKHSTLKSQISTLSSGFTLVEIAIAIAIAIIIISAAYASFTIGEKASRKSLQKAELAQNGRISLDRISREIRQTTEIVTLLPSNKDDPSNPPPSEIMFEDGHTAITQYITYYKDGANLKRKITHFYFGDTDPPPLEWAVQGAKDADGNPPSEKVDEDEIVAEYINQLQFYGERIVNIDLTVQKNEEAIDFKTSAFGRNL
jgi:type II secretory pathway pseudopilin PulG